MGVKEYESMMYFQVGIMEMSFLPYDLRDKKIFGIRFLRQK